MKFCLPYQHKVCIVIKDVLGILFRIFSHLLRKAEIQTMFLNLQVFQLLGIKPVGEIDLRLQFVQIEHNLEQKARIYKVNDELLEAEPLDNSIKSED